MKKLCLVLILTLAAVSVAEASWLQRDWLTKGNGWAEKGAVRAGLDDHGSITFTLSDDVSADISGDVSKTYVKSIDIRAELNISKFNITGWEFHELTNLSIPLPIPDIAPTLDNPFVIQGIPFKTEEVRLDSYSITIESESRGTLKAKGTLLRESIDFELTNVLWQKGTPEPDTPDNKSGCNAGYAAAALVLIPLLALKKRK